MGRLLVCIVTINIFMNEMRCDVIEIWRGGCASTSDQWKSFTSSFSQPTLVSVLLIEPEKSIQWSGYCVSGSAVASWGLTMCIECNAFVCVLRGLKTWEATNFSFDNQLNCWFISGVGISSYKRHYHDDCSLSSNFQPLSVLYGSCYRIKNRSGYHRSF